MRSDTRAAVWPLDPTTYAPHWLHRDQRTWTESNCYVDLWIEVLHALGLDPMACLAFCLATDFEGDQWTFFKPPLGDLRDLYGIHVEELNVWRPLVQHALEQLALGRLVISEVDAHFLPDTAGTSYGVEHTKTSIAMHAIDLGARWLGYFHAGGYHTLRGADFDAVFRITPGLQLVGSLAPYVEIVKLDHLARVPVDTLAAHAFELLGAHVAHLPGQNPFGRYLPRFDSDLAWLASEPLQTFHAYAFATIRQFGASFELAALFLRWLADHGHPELSLPATELDNISTAAKRLLLKTARVASGRSAGELSATIGPMSVAWERATHALAAYCAAPRNPVSPARG